MCIVRVVDTDNFGGDYPDEKFVTEVLTEDACKKIADVHNAKCGYYAYRYWKVVPDDYKLEPGFEP